MNWKTDLGKLIRIPEKNAENQNTPLRNNIHKIHKKGEVESRERNIVDIVDIVLRNPFSKPDAWGSQNQASIPYDNIDKAEIAPWEVTTDEKARPAAICSTCGNNRFIKLDDAWKCQRCAGLTDQEVNARKFPTLSLSAQWK